MTIIIESSFFSRLLFYLVFVGPVSVAKTRHEGLTVTALDPSRRNAKLAGRVPS